MKPKFQKLEMLRGFAAVYVFAGHLLRERILSKSSRVGLLLAFGQEAVMLFFLISGFVVYYSTAKHGDLAFRPYFARRLRRIYPIYLVALLLSYLCASPVVRAAVTIPQLLGNLCLLQDFSRGKPGVWVDPLCANFVLWSLSYEWWFYMMFFPVYRLVRPAWQLHAVTILSLIGYATYSLHPNQASLFLTYFIFWWCGAELARSYLDGVPLTLGTQRRPVLCLTLFSGLLAAPVLLAAWNRQPLSFGVHPILELRHSLACWLFLVVGLLWARAGWKGFDAIFQVFGLAAPISYALYVFHYPLAVSSTYLSSVPNSVLRTLGYILVTFAAAYVAEGPYQKLVNRLTKTRSYSKSRVM